MRLICLVDNCVRPSSNLWGEHGLAFWIETPDGAMLWDTGMSGTVLLHNMASLNLAPEELEAVAISHGHRDHTGGLLALIRHARARVPLYAHPAVFRERFTQRDGELRSIGIPISQAELVAAGVVVRLAAEPTEVLPGVWTSGEIAPRPAPEGRSPRHMVRQGSELVADPYQDDMALVLDMPIGLVLVCGCCHGGLINTLRCVQQRFSRDVVAIAGGTHLVSADQAELAQIGRELSQMVLLRSLWLNHCSGPRTVDRLGQLLGEDRVYGLAAGTILELDRLIHDGGSRPGDGESRADATGRT